MTHPREALQSGRFSLFSPISSLFVRGWLVVAMASSAKMVRPVAGRWYVGRCAASQHSLRTQLETYIAKLRRARRFLTHTVPPASFISA